MKQSIYEFRLKYIKTCNKRKIVIFIFFLNKITTQITIENLLSSTVRFHPYFCGGNIKKGKKCCKDKKCFPLLQFFLLKLIYTSLKDLIRLAVKID